MAPKRSARQVDRWQPGVFVSACPLALISKGTNWRGGAPAGANERQCPGAFRKPERHAERRVASPAAMWRGGASTLAPRAYARGVRYLQLRLGGDPA